MLFHLLYALRHQVSGLNVVRYITFRTAVASLTALFLVLVLGPWMIERLRRLQIGQFIREEGPEAHKAKAGTPTMGGVLILTGILVPTLLWGDLTNRNIWILVLSTLAFGLIGFADDYLKVVRKQKRFEPSVWRKPRKLRHRVWLRQKQLKPRVWLRQRPSKRKPMRGVNSTTLRACKLFLNGCQESLKQQRRR